VKGVARGAGRIGAARNEWAIDRGNEGTNRRSEIAEGAVFFGVDLASVPRSSLIAKTVGRYPARKPRPKDALPPLAVRIFDRTRSEILDQTSNPKDSSVLVT
jgi:hypothetical protein